MYIVSVNRGLTEPISNAETSGFTGIYKRPVLGAVTITTYVCTGID